MAEKKKAAPPKPVVRIVDPAEREKVLKTAMAQLEKKFGEGTVMFMGENRRMDIESISTGSLMLDLALGIGGLPRGRIIEIYGTESSGKTTISLQAVAEAQKAGGMAAFIDVEHALDPDFFTVNALTLSSFAKVLTEGSISSCFSSPLKILFLICVQICS